VIGGILVALIVAVLVLLRHKFRLQQGPHPAPAIGQGAVGEKNALLENSNEHNTSGEIPSGALRDERVTSGTSTYLVDDN
jgi:hypothetical protein